MIRLENVVAAAAVILACAAPLDAQMAWDIPRLAGPESLSGMGIYWTRAEVLAGDDDAVFGAGDAVSWPSARVGARTRSQQWTTASDQGRHLGKLLVHGESAGPFDHDLYFWSDQYGTRVQGFGTPIGAIVVLDRDPAARRYLAAFRDGDRVVGAVGINAPRGFVTLRKLARRGQPWMAVDGRFATLTHLDGGIT